MSVMLGFSVPYHIINLYSVVIIIINSTLLYKQETKEGLINYRRICR